MQAQGLDAQFFFRNTATGNVDEEDAAAGNLNYAVGTGNALPDNPGPGNNVSGIWRGFIEAPDSGFYNIVVEMDATANATLSMAGKAVPLTQHGRVWRNTDPIELTAGSLSHIVITIQKVKDQLAVKWESPTRPREVIPARYLYPPNALDLFSEAYIRFLKAASLATALSLTEDELSHLATRQEYEVGGEPWLNALTVTGNPTKPVAAALVKPFIGLLEFARIKNAIAPDDDSLLKILRDPAAATATSASLLFALTRWDVPSLTDVVTHFGGTIAELRRFEFFRRVVRRLRADHHHGHFRRRDDCGHDQRSDRGHRADAAGGLARSLRRLPTGAMSYSRSTTTCAGCSATRWWPTSFTRCARKPGERTSILRTSCSSTS